MSIRCRCCMSGHETVGITWKNELFYCIKKKFGMHYNLFCRDYITLNVPLAVLELTARDYLSFCHTE